MKTGLFLSFLAAAFLQSEAQSQCDLSGGKFDSTVSFPDIEKYAVDSYIMGVEYSVPEARETVYCTEYYEAELKKGRLDGHQDGKKFQYLYQADTFEAWVVEPNKCERVNATSTPDFAKSDMTDWIHSKDPGKFTTIGPSAMFKVAFDEWKKQSADQTMAYMGPVQGTIRGEKAAFYRRCLNESSYSYVDYFFAVEEEQNAWDVDVFDKNFTPLRVVFYNLTGKEPEMATQYYDIISFQHQIPVGVDPFALPKGRNCTHDIDLDGPKMPDFSAYSQLISAEVLYRKINTANDANQLMSSYYSTFMFAIDLEINHVSYRYSSWNTTKPDKDHQEPFVNSPKYIVYDTLHKYLYKLDYGLGKCYISRDKSFTPYFRLPEDGGDISLNDPYIFFPNDEFSFLTKATERGLTVNVFEAAMEDYPLFTDFTTVKRMFASRSYLTDNEEVDGPVSVRNSLKQVELHLFRKDDIEEVLTFNIFGFTTRLPKKNVLFDISSCFKNDDDYLYLTIGFEPEPRYLQKLEKKLTDVEENVLNSITLSSELNPARIPYVTTEMKDNYIFVTMIILGKPPLILDFPDVVNDMTVSVSSQDDVQGISTFDECANSCLEEKNGCWGFSICGSTCYYGTTDNTKVENRTGCLLYKRYSNETYMQSKELQANSIVNKVDTGFFEIMIYLEETQEKVTMKATVAQITDPAEDDELFQKMGNMLNPRMRVLKTSSKLKKGLAVKNLGKLRYDECQKLCLDFKECETISYCLVDSECVFSSKYGVDLKAEDYEENNLCIVLTRKYADHFDRSPGVLGSGSGGVTVVAATLEDCARECLKQTQFKCLSFDHCSDGERKGCHMYTVHYPKSGLVRPENGSKGVTCGHYSRKYSVDFKKKSDSRMMGSNFQTILNLTLEECASRCIEFGGGACFGYDFCQDKEMYATSCTLIDKDPSSLKSAYSPICSSYTRSKLTTAPEYAPLPYTKGYAGGIGFLCFLVGGFVGAVIVFGIAYFRVNRR